MKRLIIIIVYSTLFYISYGQSITQKLARAYGLFNNDQQLKYAVSSLYVIDAKTGKVVFDKNSQIGLAPASTQKIITAVTAFELLGKDYKYKTEFLYEGEIKDKILNGNIYIKGDGDPTLGSNRYFNTSPESIGSKISSALHTLKIDKHIGALAGITDRFSSNIPDGWVWQDIGNYYGAAAYGLNWNENQYDLVLMPGKKEGDPVKIIRTNPEIKNPFFNRLTSGARNSSDEGYIYFEPRTGSNYVSGTVPCCVDSFVISGAVPDGNYFTLRSIQDILRKNKFDESNDTSRVALNLTPASGLKLFYVHYSPALDSIVYWFLRKSINLYGEALVKSLAYQKKGYGATDDGVTIVKDFWHQKGLDVRELNLYDGSGLSPMNRVTTHAQVEVLKYARKQNWFRYFHDALPEYNGMKMKSGTINDVKGFCGYYTSKEGKEYIFSFLVNNYNGSSLSLVNKMYKVLDILK